MLRVIFPNLRSALLSGALLTFAIVVGEVTLASFLGVPAFGPYLFLLGQHRGYEPAALSFASLHSDVDRNGTDFDYLPADRDKPLACMNSSKGIPWLT